MKTQVSTPIMVAIIVVVLLIAGYFGWKVINPSGPGLSADQAQKGADMGAKMKAMGNQINMQRYGKPAAAPK
jgi:hypothetical protein